MYMVCFCTWHLNYKAQFEEMERNLHWEGSGGRDNLESRQEIGVNQYGLVVCMRISEKLRSIFLLLKVSDNEEK